MDYSQQVDEWVNEMVRRTAIQNLDVMSALEDQQWICDAQKESSQALDMSYPATPEDQQQIYDEHNRPSDVSYLVDFLCEDQQTYEADQDYKETSYSPTVPQPNHPTPSPQWDFNATYQAMLQNFTLQDQPSLNMYQNLGYPPPHGQQVVMPQQYFVPLAAASPGPSSHPFDAQGQLQSSPVYSSEYQGVLYPMPSHSVLCQDQAFSLLDQLQIPQMHYNRPYQTGSPQASSSTYATNSPVNTMSDVPTIYPASTATSPSPAPTNAPVLDSSRDRCYRCPIPACGLALSKKEISAHARTHYQTPSNTTHTLVQCKVPGCTTVGQVCNMPRHTKIHLKDVLTAWCATCGEYLARGDALRRHAKKRHGIDLPKTVRAKGVIGMAKTGARKVVVREVQQGWKKPCVQRFVGVGCGYSLGLANSPLSLSL